MMKNRLITVTFGMIAAIAVCLPSASAQVVLLAGFDDGADGVVDKQDASYLGLALT
jgi:hypothetical protein